MHYVLGLPFVELSSNHTFTQEAVQQFMYLLAMSVHSASLLAVLFT
jgi:hypothetical protein